jgi:hypothetical protein
MYIKQKKGLLDFRAMKENGEKVTGSRRMTTRRLASRSRRASI